jgi:hypothetical protein
VRERIDAVLGQQKLQQKGREYLSLIKDRNRDFLDQYKVLRADLDAWMASRAPRD